MTYTDDYLLKILIDLSKPARNVLDVLCFYCKGGMGCLITNDFLIKETRLHKQHLSSAVNELIEAGLILPRISLKTRKIRGYYINPWYYWSGNVYSRNKRINLWKHLEVNWVEWNRRHFPKRKHGFPPGYKPKTQDSKAC